MPLAATLFFVCKNQINRALIFSETYLKFLPNPTPNYTFKMHFRTCSIIFYISFSIMVVSFRFSSPTCGKSRCSYKIVLTKKTKCKFQTPPSPSIRGQWSTPPLLCGQRSLRPIYFYRRSLTYKNDSLKGSFKKYVRSNLVFFLTPCSFFI